MLSNFLFERMLPKKKDDGTMSCIRTNYDNCMYNALTQHMKNQTLSENGCTVPWVRNTTNICKEPKNINTTFWIAWNRITNQFNDCPVPCDSLLVSLGAKNFEIDESSEKASWTLFFAARTYLSEQDFLYTSLSLVAEIGKVPFINEVWFYKNDLSV